MTNPIAIQGFDHIVLRVRDKADYGRVGLADAPEGDDSITETDGVSLVVDAMSLDLVAGCVVDYVENMGGASFRVENPNAAASCGCGSSFAV